MSQFFTRWFGVALVAHVVGNWAQPDLPSPVGIVNLLVGLVGLVLIARPERWLLLAGSALTIASFLLEIPFTGNHWAVAALAGLGILLGAGRFDGFAPALRLVFLVFYGFAAFAKLNSAFFDPTVSCAVFYTNQTLDGFGLTAVSPDSILARLAVWFTAAIELSVVPLLAVRRTRWIGVWLAAGFHLLISLDLNQHFYDFTSVVLLMLILFVEPKSSNPEDQSKPPRLRLVVGLWFAAFVLVVLANLPQRPELQEILQTVPFLIWISVSIWWIGRMLKTQIGFEPMFRPSALTAVAVLLAALNGLTPYTEVKTAFSFNMYSNLTTARGETNHLLIRTTAPLRSGYDNPIEIVSSTDPNLEAYRDAGYLIAEPELVVYLEDRSSTFVGRRSGEAIDETDLLPRGQWWHRWLPLRAIDAVEPTRCQATFLPVL
jgi:hypothetical protein